MKDKEKEKATQKRYIKNNRDKVRKMRRDYNHKYYYLPIPHKKALIRANAGHKLRQEIIKLKKCCEACGSKSSLELHHVEYVNEVEYIQLLCKYCHRAVHQD